MKTNHQEQKLTGAQLVARLQNTPARRIGRMQLDEQKALLWRVILGEAQVTEAEGSALLDALRLHPHEVHAAIERVEAIRRRNIEGRANWERLQVIDAATKEPLAALTAKAVELFGEDYETIRPCVFEVDYQRDLCVASVPALAPLTDLVTAAMQGRYDVARFAQMIEEQLNSGDLFGLVERRREIASDVARRAS